MKSKIFIIFTFFFICFESFSQDTLLLLNGKVLNGKIFAMDDETIYFNTFGKKKLNVIDRDEIFSVKRKNGFNLMYYKQDTAIGNDFTVGQMRKYILGEQQAMKFYKSPLSTTGGIVSGIAGIVFLDFWGLPVPALYTIIVSSKKPKIKKKYLINTDLINNQYFVNGYQSYAKHKKAKNAIKGGIIGLAASVGAMMIFQK